MSSRRDADEKIALSLLAMASALAHDELDGAEREALAADLEQLPALVRGPMPDAIGADGAR